MPDEPTRDVLDLITGLCLEASRIMEDESPTLALALPGNAADVAARIAMIHQDGADLVALAAAAEMLLRRGDC